MRRPLCISLATLVCIWSAGAWLIAYVAEAAAERPENEADAQFLQNVAGIGLLLAIALVVGVARAAPRLWLLPLALAHIGVFLFTLALVETAPDFGQRVVAPIIAVGAVAESLALLAVLLTRSRPRKTAF
jgi:hypothetical protein